MTTKKARASHTILAKLNDLLPEVEALPLNSNDDMATGQVGGW